jgi:type I restriction enzyme S subunit
MDVSENDKITYSVKKGDIFLTRTSESLDELAMSCVADKDYPETTYSGFLKRLRPTQNDITYDRFMAFYLRSELFRKTMTNNAIMTLRASFNEQIFSYLDLILPDYEEQKKSGDFLYRINQKIKLNNKINAELEAMAKTLYDYWFVQFDFPNAHGKPYKTSGGKMIWNEELKREIPVGWEAKEMSKLLVKNNVKYDYKGFGFDTIDLSVMPSSTMCLTERNHSDSFSTNLFYLKKFDILFGAIRPYLLKAGFAPFNGLVTGTVHSFRTIKMDYYNFALLTIIQKSVFKHAISNSKGTKMPVIGSDDLVRYKVPFDEDIIIKFNESLSFKEIIAHNINENQQLTELRNWLLPMLMNGQVSVGGYEVEDSELGMVAEDKVEYKKS